MATSTFYATNSGRWHNGSGNMQPTNYAYGWISGNDPCTGRFYAYPEYLGNYGNRYGLVWFDTAAISAAMADQNISGVTLTLRRTDTGGYNPSRALMGTADKYLYVWGLKLAAAGKGSTAIGNTYGVSKSYVSTVGAKYATYNSPIYRNSTITVTIPAALFTAWLADGITGLMVCDGDDSNVTQGDANHVYGDGMNGRVDNPPPYYDEGSTYGYMTFAGYDNATYKPYLTITHAPSVPNPTPPSGILTVSPLPVKTATATFDWGDASDTVFTSSQLFYEMPITYNGGASWSATYTSTQGSSQYSLNIKTALGLAAGQYYYNTNCQFRVRTKTPLYNGQHYYSSWVTSGAFTIDYRIPPSVPTSLTPSKANPYEGESISFTVGRPSSYNTHNAAGAVMQMTYYVKLASGTALTNATEPVTSSSKVVPYTVGNLTSGKSDLATSIRAYCKDAQGQQGPETGNVAFTVRRFRAPAVIVENVEREEESAVIHLLVTDTGYGGTQSGSQINKIEYRLDGGAWNDATLLGWDGLKNSFEITSLSAAARYTMEVRAVNNAPAGTSLSDKTGSAHQSLLLEFLPQGGFYKNKTTGVGMVYSRAAIIGPDPTVSVNDGDMIVADDIYAQGNKKVWHEGNDSVGRVGRPIVHWPYKGSSGSGWWRVFSFTPTGGMSDPSVVHISAFSDSSGLADRAHWELVLSGVQGGDPTYSSAYLRSFGNITPDMFQLRYSTTTGTYTLFFYIPQYTYYGLYITFPKAPCPYSLYNSAMEPTGSVNIPVKYEKAPVLLWSGSWSSGDIAIADIAKYTLFNIMTSDTAAPFVGVKSANGQLLVGYTITGDAGVMTTRTIWIPISGTTLTLAGVRGMTHYAGASHGERAGYSITSIHGVV